MDAAQMPGVCVFTIQVALPSGICPWTCSPDGGLAEPLKIQCCLVLCFINIVPSDICATVNVKLIRIRIRIRETTEWWVQEHPW